MLRKPTRTISTALLTSMLIFMVGSSLPAMTAQIPSNSALSAFADQTTTASDKSMQPVQHAANKTSLEQRFAHDSALVKKGWVSTPIGFLPPGCVFEVGDNAKINKDNSVDMANGTHFVPPDCRDKVPSSPDPTTGTVEEADGCYCPESPPAIKSFQGKWTVPPAPTQQRNPLQIIYLWIGLEPGVNTSYPLIQPVLEWGKHGAVWDIGSWYCTAYQVCFESTYYQTSVGKTLTGTLTGSNCNASAACTWVTTLGDGTHTTTQTYVSAKAMYRVLAGVLEVYNVDTCNEYPARGTTPTQFNSYSITDTSGRTVSPGWTASVNLPFPQCNENVVIGPSSSYSNLFYGPN